MTLGLSDPTTREEGRESDRSRGTDVFKGLTFHFLVNTFDLHKLHILQAMITRFEGKISEENDNLGIICIVASLDDCSDDVKPVKAKRRSLYASTDQIPGIHAFQQVIVSSWITQAITTAEDTLPNLEIGWNGEAKPIPVLDDNRKQQTTIHPDDQTQFDFIVAQISTFKWDTCGRPEGGDGELGEGRGSKGRQNVESGDDVRSVRSVRSHRGLSYPAGGEAVMPLAGHLEHISMDVNTGAMIGDGTHLGQHNLNEGHGCADNTGNNPKVSSPRPLGIKKRKRAPGKADFYNYCDDMAKKQRKSFNKATVSFYRRYGDLLNPLFPQDYTGARLPTAYSGHRCGPIRRVDQALSASHVHRAFPTLPALTTTALHDLKANDPYQSSTCQWEGITLDTASFEPSLSVTVQKETETISQNSIVGCLYILTRLPILDQASERPIISELFLRRYLLGLCATSYAPFRSLHDIVGSGNTNTGSQYTLIPHVSRRNAKIVWLGAICLSATEAQLGVAIGSWTSESVASEIILRDDLWYSCKSICKMVPKRINIVSPSNILSALYGLKRLVSDDITLACLVPPLTIHGDDLTGTTQSAEPGPLITFTDMVMDGPEVPIPSMAQSVLDIWCEGSKIGSVDDEALEAKEWFTSGPDGL